MNGWPKLCFDFRRVGVAAPGGQVQPHGPRFGPRGAVPVFAQSPACASAFG